MNVSDFNSFFELFTAFNFLQITQSFHTKLNRFFRQDFENSREQRERKLAELLVEANDQCRELEEYKSLKKELEDSINSFEDKLKKMFTNTLYFRSSCLLTALICLYILVLSAFYTNCNDNIFLFLVPVVIIGLPYLIAKSILDFHNREVIDKQEANNTMYTSLVLFSVVLIVSLVLLLHQEQLISFPVVIFVFGFFLFLVLMRYVLVILGVIYVNSASTLTNSDRFNRVLNILKLNNLNTTDKIKEKKIISSVFVYLVITILASISMIYLYDHPSFLDKKLYRTIEILLLIFIAIYPYIAYILRIIGLNIVNQYRIRRSLSSFKKNINIIESSYSQELEEGQNLLNEGNSLIQN